MDNYTAQIAISESDFPIVADCDCLRATEAFYHMDRVTDFCVMIYVTEGIMYVTEDGHDYEISPGEILFLKAVSGITDGLKPQGGQAGFTPTSA